MKPLYNKRTNTTERGVGSSQTTAMRTFRSGPETKTRGGMLKKVNVADEAVT